MSASASRPNGVNLEPAAANVFGGSGRRLNVTSSSPDPTPKSLFRSSSLLRNCRKVLRANHLTLWLHNSDTYYVIVDYEARQAYVITGSRAGSLERDLATIGYVSPRPNDQQRLFARTDKLLVACLTGYLWMDAEDSKLFVTILADRYQSGLCTTVC